MIDIQLISYMNEMMKQTPLKFHRYLYDKIDWNDRLVGIVGPRGVGKSTMLLQRLIESGGENALYISADTLYFTNHTLVEVADEFVKDNGKRLYIDEIHKYPNWSQELKQIYDVHPDLSVAFTGSSILDIKKGYADLSRRVLMYKMQGLSFREYLEMHHGIISKAYTIDEIVSNKVSIPEIEHPLPLFREYLADGYYPFGKGSKLVQRLLQVIDQTIEVDIALYAGIKASTTRKLKRMFAIISDLAPFKPIASSLAREIGVSNENVPDYLSFLDMTGMIALLHDDTGGLRNLGKIEKAYIDNPTLMTVLAGGKPNIGNLRETFFYNQTRVNNDVVASRIADFKIGDLTFEVGGKNKTNKQLKGASSGYVVKDEIEIGYGDIIPLWHFGFNY